MPDFVEDVAAATDALGAEASGIIMGIGMTHWDSAEQRDEFLSQITGGKYAPNK